VCSTPSSAQRRARLSAASSARAFEHASPLPSSSRWRCVGAAFGLHLPRAGLARRQACLSRLPRLQEPARRAIASSPCTMTRSTHHFADGSTVCWRVVSTPMHQSCTTPHRSLPFAGTSSAPAQNTGRECWTLLARAVRAHSSSWTSSVATTSAASRALRRTRVGGARGVTVGSVPQAHTNSPVCRCSSPCSRSCR